MPSCGRRQYICKLFRWVRSECDWPLWPVNAPRDDFLRRCNTQYLLLNSDIDLLKLGGGGTQRTSPLGPIDTESREMKYMRVFGTGKLEWTRRIQLLENVRQGKPGADGWIVLFVIRFWRNLTRLFWKSLRHIQLTFIYFR